MSLLLLFNPSCPPENPDGVGTGAFELRGNLEAFLDAIFKEDDRIGGRGVTRLASTLEADQFNTLYVESTIGFGENTDGTGDARLLINGEIIEAACRNSNDPFVFGQLTRGVENTDVKLHPEGSIVIDLSRNTGAIDLLRRGFFVETATGEDLKVIARNLGLELCPGVDEEALRRIIQAVAYLPKQTIHAFVEALNALFDGSPTFTVYELLVSRPWHVFVEVDAVLSTDIRGRFLLNGGEPQLTTGANTVDVDYTVNHVIGVYDDTPLTRRGYRDGFTNYYGAGSFLGQTLTMAASPGGAGTPVIVDYGAFSAHYLALDETVRQDLQQADRWAYLADPLLSARCLLDQIRAAGIKVELSTRL